MTSRARSHSLQGSLDSRSQRNRGEMRVGSLAHVQFATLPVKQKLGLFNMLAVCCLALTSQLLYMLLARMDKC
jgi:hypothetical protein